MIPKVSQSEEIGHEGNTGERRYPEYELWELGEIGIVLVRGKNDPNYSIWKEMLEEHHYLHSAKLYGQQIKYLVALSSGDLTKALQGIVVMHQSRCNNRQAEPW